MTNLIIVVLLGFLGLGTALYAVGPVVNAPSIAASHIQQVLGDR